jgi:hypothetical protein
MRTKLRLCITPELATELFAAAKPTGLPVEKYVEQIVEVWAAETRMVRLAADRMKAKGLQISRPANPGSP